MTRVVKKCCVRARRHARELSHGQVEIPLAGVDREHNLEIQRPEHGSHIFRVVFRIEKNQTGVLVLGIANDQCDLSLGPRRVGREHDTENAAQDSDP